MVTAAIHPTGECYGLANIFLAKLAAVMCTFHGCILEKYFSAVNIATFFSKFARVCRFLKVWITGFGPLFYFGSVCISGFTEFPTLDISRN
jgi:hypothetical protein